MSTFSNEMNKYLNPPEDDYLTAEELEDLADDEGNRLHEWRSEYRDEEAEMFERHLEYQLDL